MPVENWHRRSMIMSGPKKLFILFSLTTLAVMPFVVSAADDPGTWFMGIICNLLKKIVWPFFLGAAIVMIIWAGYRFLSSNGDPSKITEAKRAVIFAVIGIIVAILAFSAVGFIGTLVGSSASNLTCPSGSSSSGTTSGGLCLTNEECASRVCIPHPPSPGTCQ